MLDIRMMIQFFLLQRFWLLFFEFSNPTGLHTCPVPAEFSQLRHWEDIFESNVGFIR